MSTEPLKFCPKPLLPLADFPDSGGSINGRFCTTIPTPFGTTWPCCVPCPMQEWLYPDNFSNLVDAASYLNLASVAACLFILLSFWILPTTQTHRHYLSVCLTFAVLIMELAFVVGLASRGKEHLCINDITPYDMSSSVACALSGTFVLLGGWCVVMWVFLRALSLHLQICWQVTPGRHYFYAAQAIGWVIPAGMTAVALAITGVSQRFGNTCHINTKNGLPSFWGPLLAFAAASIVIQFVTFGYCINVYLRSLFEDAPPTEGGSITYTNSRISATYTQALRRVKRVIAMQWRGILVVIVVIVDIIIFATVFLQFEGTTERTPANIERGTAWLTCVITNGGDKNKCLKEGGALAVPEGTAIAVLFLLSCNGFWVALFLGRWSMIPGWLELFRNLFTPKKTSDEFVSFNVARPASFGPNPRTYEDLPSSATSYRSDDRFKDDHKGEGSYEMANSGKNTPILVRESFRPKKNPRRSLSASGGVGYKSGRSERPPVVNEDEELGMGYSATVSGGYGRPGFNRSVTAPIGIARTSSLRKDQNPNQELDALEMSIASSNRGRQNQRAFPSAHRI